MTSALLALLLHPTAQARSQAEIDSVVGRERLPDFSDRKGLPYVSAICREVLRSHVILPLGTDHAAIQDDIFEGWFIPKGQTLPPSTFTHFALLKCLMSRVHRYRKCLVSRIVMCGNILDADLRLDSSPLLLKGNSS